MDGKIVMTTVAVAILLMIGIWTVSLVSNSVTLPTFGFTESMTFAANNTYYAPSHTPIMGVTAMYNSTAAPRCTYETRLYQATNTGVRIFTNGTELDDAKGCTNMTLAGGHVLIYTAQADNSNTTWTNISGSIWNAFSLIAVVLIVIAAVAILSYFGFSRMGSE
jgi:hypothetical protein